MLSSHGAARISISDLLATMVIILAGFSFLLQIIGHMASRLQPVRYAGQYQPVQAGPAYVHPNSQAVSSRRVSLVIFVPVS